MSIMSYILQLYIHGCRHPNLLNIYTQSKYILEFHSTLHISADLFDCFGLCGPTSAGSMYPCDVWVDAPSVWIKRGLLTLDWLSPIMGPLLWGRPTQAEGGPAWGSRLATLRVRGRGTVTQRYGDISPDLREVCKGCMQCYDRSGFEMGNF